MGWNRRPVIIQQPPPRPETPKERYLLILEAEPYSDYAAAVAYFLGKHEDKSQALLYAKRLASDPEPALRFAGAAALARLHCEGSRDAEHGIWALLEDPSPRVRAKIAEDLKWDNLPETGRLKQALARDHDAAVRIHAAKGLYVHNDETSRSALVALTKDTVDAVRAEALDALQSIEEEANPPSPADYLHCVVDPSHLVRASIAAWLRWADHTFAYPHLVQLCQDVDSLVRLWAVRSIAENRSEVVTGMLRSATNDPDPWVRAEALRSMQHREYPACLAIHLSHASDSSTEVRKVVANYLEREPSPDHLAFLEKFSEDEANMHIRRAALRGLEKIPGAEAETLIVRMLKDPSQLIRKAAKKALEKRAKEQGVSRDVTNTIRFGVEEAVATRLAFHGRTRTPLKAWEDFLADVQRLDGRPFANSETSPTVQLETMQGANHCIFPFGPAHWIRIDLIPQTNGPVLMAYAIQTAGEIESWSQSILVQHFAHGRRLAKRLGWFQLAGSNPTRKESKNQIQSSPLRQERTAVKPLDPPDTGNQGSA